MAEEKTDTDMTPEERLVWLRERGIQITTPEERLAGQVAGAMRHADALFEDEISYVLVPADTSKHLQELTFRPTAEATGDLLEGYLKPVFRSKSDEIDLGLLQQQATQTLAGSVDTPTTVSDATLKQVAAEGSVETFALVQPIPSNQFTGINIYLDEAGMLKRMPLNKRAADYASRAGFNPAPQFFGDVFLGRVQKKPALRNLSFVLGPDTAFDAPWLQAATTENLEYQMEMNRISGREHDVQPAVAGDGKSKEEDGFTWTQTEEELEVVVPLSSGAKSKDVKVKFRPQLLQVSCQDHKIVPALQLFERVNVDACTWTLEGSDDNRRLVVSMEKHETAFWPRVQD